MSILIPACFFHCGHLSVSGLSDDLVPQTAVGVTVTGGPIYGAIYCRKEDEKKQERETEKGGKKKRKNKRAKDMAKKRRIWSENKRKITKKRKQRKMF